MKLRRLILPGGLLIWAFLVTQSLAASHGADLPLLDPAAGSGQIHHNEPELTYTAISGDRWSPMKMPVGVYQRIGNRDGGVDRRVQAVLLPRVQLSRQLQCIQNLAIVFECAPLSSQF